MINNLKNDKKNCSSWEKTNIKKWIISIQTQESLRLSEDTKVTKEESNIFYSEHIENEVINLTSEAPSYENHFETKFQAKFDTYNQSFKKQ